MLQDDAYVSEVDFKEKGEDDVAVEESKSGIQKINKSTSETHEIKQKPSFNHFKLFQGIARKSVSIYNLKPGIEVFLPRDLGVSSIDDTNRYQSDIMIGSNSKYRQSFSFYLD